MASDDDSARAGRLALDDLVGGLEALLVVGGAELVRERVGADGAEVGGRVGGEDVLRASEEGISAGVKEDGREVGEEAGRKGKYLGGAGGVLGGTAGDVVDLVVLLEVVVAVPVKLVNPNSFFPLGRAGEREKEEERPRRRTSRTACPRRGRRRWP